MPSRRSAEHKTVTSCWWSFWDNALPSSGEKSISPRVEPISWSLSLRKASEVRGGQGTGKPGQAIQEAEACPGPSLWRTLLTLQLTAKQDVGQGPVYTVDQTVSICGLCQSFLDRSQIRSDHLLFRNGYHFLSSEQRHRDTHLSSVPFVLALPFKPPQSPSQSRYRPLAPFAGPSTLNQFLYSSLAASALLLESFMLPLPPCRLI